MNTLWHSICSQFSKNKRRLVWSDKIPVYNYPRWKSLVLHIPPTQAQGSRPLDPSVSYRRDCLAVSCSADCSFSNCSFLCSSWDASSYFCCNAVNSLLSNRHFLASSSLNCFSPVCLLSNTVYSKWTSTEVMKSFVNGTDKPDMCTLIASLTLWIEVKTRVCM